MKELKVIFVVLVLLACIGCTMGYYPSGNSTGIVTSQDLFVCEGVSCIYAEVRYPVTIYNPNNYIITVTSDGIDYVIAPLAALELKEDKAK